MHRNTLCKSIIVSKECTEAVVRELPFTAQLIQLCKPAWTSAVQMHAASVHVWIIGEGQIQKAVKRYPNAYENALS